MGYDLVVVGAGLWGSACARHLADMGARVALIGPAEPKVTATHDGVFGSHYDQARITRRLDSRRDWSRFAAASLGRYAEIERKSDQQFFHRVGSVIAGPSKGLGRDYVGSTREIAEAEGTVFDALSGSELNARFPFFDFPDDVATLFEPEGGWIDPRAHVAAEIALAQASGATLIRDEVVTIDERAKGVLVTCRGGAMVEADKAVVAAGAFSKAEGLLPEPLPLAVYARTIAFLEIDTAEATRLKEMPSVIYILPDGVRDIYVLPPVLYPDGKVYLKIGGDPDNLELNTVAEMKDWFRSGGNPVVGTYLVDQLRALMPSLRVQGTLIGACATSFTPQHNPLIHGQTERIFALTGGNGAGAKCADEIGRIGANVVLGKSLPKGLYQTDFKP